MLHVNGCMRGYNLFVGKAPLVDFNFVNYGSEWYCWYLRIAIHISILMASVDQPFRCSRRNIPGELFSTMAADATSRQESSNMASDWQANQKPCLKILFNWHGWKPGSNLLMSFSCLSINRETVGNPGKAPIAFHLHISLEAAQSRPERGTCYWPWKSTFEQHCLIKWLMSWTNTTSWSINGGWLFLHTLSHTRTWRIKPGPSINFFGM